jgi:uncharacterized protein
MILNIMQTTSRNLLVLLALWGCSVASGDSIVLVTGAENGAYHRIGEVLGQSTAALDGSVVEVRVTDGSLQNVELLQSGGAEFGIVQGGLTADLTGIAGIAVVGDELLHIVVPNDSSIMRSRDLVGKRIGVGPQLGGSATLAADLVSFLGYDVELVYHSLDESEALLKSGQVDAVVLVFRLFAPFVESLLSGGEYRLVPVVEAAALSRYLPEVAVATIPAHAYGPYRGIPSTREGELATVSVQTLLVARSDASDRHVNALQEALYDIRTISGARLTGLQESTGKDVLDMPLHPAALSYYHRNDPISSDSFEIASFFLAGIIALVSAAHYIVRYAQSRTLERKKQAIRPYFESMLEIGERVEAADSIEILTGLIHGMMSTQRQAEQAWLSGDLDTEHVENLYSVYNIRSRNAFDKIHQLQNEALGGGIARLTKPS